jgi:hypothetical protein
MASDKAAAAALRPGDHVEWKAPVPGGKTEGEVVVGGLLACRAPATSQGCRGAVRPGAARA